MPPYLLVVESDPELQRLIGQTLNEANYELSTETDGAWARRSLLIRPPDAIILDTNLTDGTGFSVAEALRRDPDSRNIPIFFVASRFRGASHRSEARRRYAPAEYLPVPLDLDTLLARVLETVPPNGEVPPVVIPDYPAGKLTDSSQRREKRQVEQEARQLAERAAELRGSLAREPFARLLQRIYAEKLSGALLLARDAVKKIVYFREGYPVSVRSNVLSECLGQILLHRRLIKQDVLEESLHRMKTESRHQGEILVEMGVLSPHNLERALVGQMEAKLYNIFAWQSGTFRFSEGKDAPDEPVTLEKTTAAIILEGIRRHYDPERINEVLEPFVGKYVVRSSDPLQRMQDISSDLAERRFVESIDGSRRLDAVLFPAPIAEHDARLLLVALAEAGMIEPSRTPPRRSSEEPRPTYREPTVEYGTPVRPPERRSLEELEGLNEGMRLLSHFDVLGVSEEANTAEIDRAYETRARDYHPDRFRLQTDEVRQVAFEIFERLRDAQSTLREPARRRRYAARMDRVRAEQAAVAQRSPSPAAEQVYYAGVEHLRTRHYRESVEAFRQAIALAPGQASYHGALGWAIFRESPADPTAIAAGLEELKQAVTLGDGDPWVHVSLARFYAETGTAEEAIAEFEAALEINPGLNDIQDEIRRLRGET